jgi:hypothetical protein
MTSGEVGHRQGFLLRRRGQCHPAGASGVEAPFGRMNRPRPCWAPIGIRSEVACQLIREYVYLYGAVSPKDGTCVYLIMPAPDTECFQIFLERCHRGRASDMRSARHSSPPAEPRCTSIRGMRSEQRLPAITFLCIGTRVQPLSALVAYFRALFRRDTAMPNRDPEPRAVVRTIEADGLAHV